MAPDLVTESYNRGYNEARALYEDEKLEEAIATAEAMLEDSGTQHASIFKGYLLMAARSSSIPSHQVLLAYCSMRR